MSAPLPAEIVAELDRYIVGQDDAKRAVAIALRSRWRRQQLPDDLRVEVQPRNILMIGPTGVGKTEIARRVARLIGAPFIKVEATTYTQVGYVGRDVDSIIRDLLDLAVAQLEQERLDAVQAQAEARADEQLIELLIARDTAQVGANGRSQPVAALQKDVHTAAEKRAHSRKRKRYAELLASHAIDDVTVELDVASLSAESPRIEIIAAHNRDDAQESLRELFEAFAPLPERKTLSVRDARRYLTRREAEQLVDIDDIIDTAIERVEQLGVVFIDEIDKTIQNASDYGPDVAGEGVQRDLLPIVEGATVMTRFGPVRTDHILFIAAGSFSSTRPTDLIPELQGRFPLRVELASLDEDDLYAILREPENALTKQYTALLATEGVTLTFTDDGLREIARTAAEVNARGEDIGARRLVTIVERVLEELSFDAATLAGETVAIDAAYVLEKIGDIVTDEDLSNAIL